MIAQLILTGLLLATLFYAWLEYPRSPAVGLLAVLAAWAGLFFVWFPEQATRLAAWVGIGRGVDLVIYVWIGISLIVLLNLHLKIRSQMELITLLARAIAITNAPHVRKAPAMGEGPPPQDGGPTQEKPVP